VFHFSLELLLGSLVAATNVESAAQVFIQSFRYFCQIVTKIRNIDDVIKTPEISNSVNNPFNGSEGFMCTEKNRRAAQI
jgi:hypothetical protein